MRNYLTRLEMIKNLKITASWHLALTFTVSIFISLLIIIGSKTAFGIILLLFFVLIFLAIISKFGFDKANKYLLYLVIATIPFPYLIQFMGRDATTVTTLIIVLQFAFLIFHSLQQKRILFSYKTEIVLPAMLAASFTITLLLNTYLFGQSFKFYLANISGVILFFLVYFAFNEEKNVVTALKIICAFLIVQFIVEILEFKSPEVHKYIAVFANRNYVSHLPIVEGMPRVKGTINDCELLAEWLLVGSFLSIALIYATKKYIYSIAFLCCMSGIVFTKTRSAMVLFFLGLVIYVVSFTIFKKDYNNNTLKITLLTVLGIAGFSLVFPDQKEQFMQRFQNYFQHSNLLSADAINRKAVWDATFRDFFGSLSMFGKGFRYVVLSSKDVEGETFHSLYLTVLYKNGIVGIGIYILFWGFLLKKTLQNIIKSTGNKWYLVFFLSLATVLMLINELKVEYVRYPHTIQFAWLIYALLVATIRLIERQDEDIVVS